MLLYLVPALSPYPFVIFVRKAMKLSFFRHGSSSCLVTGGLFGLTPILGSSLHALLLLGVGDFAHATLSVGGEM